MALGIFYQTVNIVAWIGPLLALHMRQMQWRYAFYTNAVVICLNFILLLTYRAPGMEERLARRQRIRESTERDENLMLAMLKELRKPHLFLYLLIFSVWWLMLAQYLITLCPLLLLPLTSRPSFWPQFFCLA